MHRYRPLYARNKSVTRRASRNVTPISRVEQSNKQVISSSKRERERKRARGGVARTSIFTTGGVLGWRLGKMRSKNLSPESLPLSGRKILVNVDRCQKISIVIALLLNVLLHRARRAPRPRNSCRYLSPFTIRFDRWKPMREKSFSFSLSLFSLHFFVPSSR